MDYINFYHREWKLAEQEGDEEYASKCKEQYRKYVMESRIKDHNYFDERLKMFPMIYLN